MMNRVRSFSTKIPSLDQQLRALYLKVHPDLFGNCPESSNTNAQSLSRLNALLGAIKNGTAPPKRCSLRFVLSDSSDPSNPSKPKEISVDYSFDERAEIHSRRTRRQLQTMFQELFAQSGLDTRFVWEKKQETGSNSVIVDTSTAFWGISDPLRDSRENSKSRQEVLQFVRDSHIRSQELRAERLEYQVELSTIMGQIRRSGVKVLSPPAEILSLYTQLTVARRFLELCRQLPCDEESLVFCFAAEESTFDSLGRVSLNVRDSLDEWKVFVSGISNRNSQEHAVVWKRKSEIESILTSLNAHVFPSAQLLSDIHTVREYCEYLFQLSSALKDSSTSLRIMICSPLTHNSPSVDHDIGVFKLPLSYDINSSLQYLEQHAHTCKELHESYVQSRLQYEDAVSQTKRLFRLASLSRDPERISRRQMLSCCTDLRKTLPQGNPFFAGMHIVVSDSYHFDRLKNLQGELSLHWQCLSKE